MDLLHLSASNWVIRDISLENAGLHTSVFTREELSQLYNKGGFEPLTWGTWTFDWIGLEGLEPLTWGTLTLDYWILFIHTIKSDSNPRASDSVSTIRKDSNPRSSNSEHSYNIFIHLLLYSTHWHWAEGPAGTSGGWAMIARQTYFHKTFTSGRNSCNEGFDLAHLQHTPKTATSNGVQLIWPGLSSHHNIPMFSMYGQNVTFGDITGRHMAFWASRLPLGVLHFLTHSLDHPQDPGSQMQQSLLS